MLHFASKSILFTLALSICLPSLARPSIGVRNGDIPMNRPPLLSRRTIRVRNVEATTTAAAPEVTAPVKAKAKLEPTDLLAGNQRFVQKIEASDPGLLKTLADEGQEPDFMFIGCSDSRVSEANIFDSKPGTLFTQRNIANQFSPLDPNAHSVLSYAVTELGVRHVIVLGHYGCGGVAAAIASAPVAGIDAASSSIQNWISPVRNLFQTSARPEIVALREANANLTATTGAIIEEPEIEEPGFRALVEENVKLQVARMAKDSVIMNHYASIAAFKSGGAPAEKRDHVHKRSGEESTQPQDVFIHGWVYDISNGAITDLNITVSPPNTPAEPAPTSAVQEIISSTTASGSSTSAPAAAAPTTTPIAEASNNADLIGSGVIVDVKRKRDTSGVARRMRRNVLRHSHVHRDGSAHAHAH